MAIVTTYACDRCGHQQNSGEQMWDIGVGIQPTAQYKPIEYLKGKSLWCRACVVGVLGLLPKNNDDPPPPSPAPTLEDMIRQIVREETAQP